MLFRSPLPADHRARSIAAQEADAHSPLNAWRRLARWRKAHPALREGDLRLIDLPAPLIGFERASPGERLLLVFNPSGRAVRLALAEYGALRPLDDHGLPMRIEADVALLPPCGVLAAALEPAAAAQPPARRATSSG